MKKFTIPFCLLLAFIIQCTGCHSQPQLLTKEQWLEDLDFLYRTLPKKHANIYHTMKKENFDSVVSELKNKIPAFSDNEIMVEFIRIVALIKDGHTDIAPRTKYYPARFGYFGNDIYLLGAEPDNINAIGGRLIKVGNFGIEEAVKKIIPLVDGDNDQENYRKVPSFLIMTEILNGLHLIKDPASANYTILTEEGKEVILNLQPVEDISKVKMISAREKVNGAIPMYTKNTDKNYWYTYLPETKTLYFQYNFCRDQQSGKSVAAFSKELFEFADKNHINFFVMDLRHNYGGNFQKNGPLLEGIKERPGLNAKGKFFIFTTRNTGSAATVIAAQLKTTTDAIFIGGVSRSNPNFRGNSEHFELPNSRLKVSYTEAVLLSFPALGTILPVDVPLDHSFEDYRTGKDRFLEAVWNYKIK